MNHEHRIIGVDAENDLQEPPSPCGGSPYEVLFSVLNEWKLGLSTSSNFLVEKEKGRSPNPSKGKKSPQESRFARMDTRELAETTERYGREMVIDEFRPMDAAARSRWERVRRKPGRPRRGKGAKVISVSVERALLSRSDKLAQNLGLSRAGLIERGLRAALAVEGKL